VRGNADGLTKRQLLPALTPFRSRELRRNATEAEIKMRRALRSAFPEAKFRFQVPLGPYHADFCSHAARLVIEIDGATHAHTESSDVARTRFIEHEGYHVLRFWNNDVMANIDGVIQAIAEHLPNIWKGAAQ
jgi:very-short-patch-repair endonuclease